MPDIEPGPESSQGQNVNPQEAGLKNQADANIKKEPVVGRAEQQTANRIRQGGNEDQTLNDIAKGGIIDMVQRPDGKWESKDPGDPSYFFDPKSRQSRQPRQQSPAAGGFSATPSKPGSARDKWNENKQQQETKPQQELTRIEAEGHRLSALIHTPEGQQVVTGTSQTIAQIVDIQAEGSRPHLTSSHVEEDAQQVQVIRSRNAELVARWQQQKQNRVQQLIGGEQMSSLEQNTYLRLALGREPLPTTDQTEIQRRVALIEQFDRTRRDVARATRYRNSQDLPPEQRPSNFSEGGLRFYGIPTINAHEAFARGWDEVRNAEGPKKPEKISEGIDVITQEQVDSYKTMLSEQYGIDLSNVSVDIAHPGDEVFDAEEIKFRYFQQPDDPSLGPLRELLEQREVNPQSVPIDRLRAAAEARGIVLEGRMPGFAAVSGDNRIVFFAVSQEDAIPMAQRYAEKEGEAGRTFATTEEASNFLRSLGEKAFLHEVGHVVYGRTGEASVADWTGFVETNQGLKDRVIAIQEDKYENVTEIPVAEEAFADYFVDVVGEGRVNSRLDPDPEAIRRVSQILIPKKPAS